MSIRAEGTRATGSAKYLIPLACLVSAFLGALFFSETTSPLFSDWGYDSAMFQTIGKYWAEGYLPYVSLFDHKGPIIFLINAAGYALCGRTGVFMLQVVFLAAGEYLAYRLLRERMSVCFSLIAALLLPVLLAANWTEGNTTEEYILPLLFASFWCMLRWGGQVERGEFTHAPRAAFLYGVTFAFALLTRVTNALGICVGVLFITVLLIVRREWKNLWQNALGFILGAAALVVPFCVYFAAHGALYDMWYGTLLFNFDYSAASGTEMQYGLTALLVLFRRYIFGWALVGAALWGAVFKGESRGKLVSAFWLLIALINTLFMYTLNDYAHYGICLLPLLYVALAELAAPTLASERRRLTRAVLIGMSAIVLFSCGTKIYKEKTIVYPPQAREDYGDDYMPLLDMIPEDGRGSFVAFDCPRRLYLQSGLRPAFRFFTLQQWMCVNSSVFAETIHREFDESNIEWVLTFDLYHTALVTTDIIAEKYTRVAVSDGGLYSLYHLNTAD